LLNSSAAASPAAQTGGASGRALLGRAMEQAFATLSSDTQEEVRRKQREKKLTKLALRQAAKAAAAPAAPPLSASASASVGAGAEGIGAGSLQKEFPDIITLEAYFGACPYGRFRDPNLAPTEANLELLLSILKGKDKQALQLNQCNYFQFSGPKAALWDPVFNARLAYEGFFTITSGRGASNEPLPELQPFYGVLTWDNFAASKHVRQTLSRLRRGGREYRLVVSSSLGSWELLEKYQKDKHGTNWLTKQYFEMMQKAAADPSVNFQVHCIDLFAAEGSTEPQPTRHSVRASLMSWWRVGASRSASEGERRPVAGEIGFSIGKVYTSLSGWTGERTAEALGTVQLVLLGRWLQQRGYVFWSLGHCYSPGMEYKRQLGHRIYPRADFLELLDKHRGAFRRAAGAGFAGLADGDVGASAVLLLGAEGEAGAGPGDVGEGEDASSCASSCSSSCSSSSSPSSARSPHCSSPSSSASSSSSLSPPPSRHVFSSGRSEFKSSATASSVLCCRTKSAC